MPPLRTSGTAVASLVFGILAFFSGGLTGVVAVVLGHVALSQIKRRPQELGGSGLAVAGLVTGYIGMALLALFVLTFGGMIFGMKNVADKAKIHRVEADFKSLEVGMESYRLNSGAYPTAEQGIDALVEKPVAAPVPERWSQISKRVPLDAWNQPYGYRFPGSVDAAKPEFISGGPDGRIGTADDISNQKP